MKSKARKKMICESCTDMIGLKIFRTSLGTKKAFCWGCKTTVDYTPTHKVQPVKHGRFRILKELFTPKAKTEVNNEQQS